MLYKQTRRTLASKEIFKDQKVVTINHNGASYVLRITKENKLILTK